MKVILLGDSDIERWPAQFHPCTNEAQTIEQRGKSGATLQQILPFVQEAIESASWINESVVFVACAGENDISSGIPLDESKTSFQSLLQTIFEIDSRNKNYLVFLGPKLEPWLADDPVARKAYIHMSNTFARRAQESVYSNYIRYIDCLLMFCGDSANQQGALWQRAIPEEKYFDPDQLHLSDQGYILWKTRVEEIIREIAHDEEKDVP